MKLTEFKRVGHWPTLLCAFVYFDTSFMVWTLLGSLGVFIAQDFHLTPGQQGSAGRGTATGRFDPARRVGYRHGPFWTAQSRPGGPGADLGTTLVGLATFDLAWRSGRHRADARRGGSKLRRRAAAGQSMVPAAISGAGPGHCRRRQLRHRFRRAWPSTSDGARSSGWHRSRSRSS